MYYKNCNNLLKIEVVEKDRISELVRAVGNARGKRQILDIEGAFKALLQENVNRK